MIAPTTSPTPIRPVSWRGPDPLCAPVHDDASAQLSKPTSELVESFPSSRELRVGVDVREAPVILRLRGTLDGRTGVHLVPLIRELVSDGHRRFLLDVDETDVTDPDGAAVLCALGQTLFGAGARSTWVRGPQQLRTTRSWPAFVDRVDDGRLTAPPEGYRQFLVRHEGS